MIMIWVVEVPDENDLHDFEIISKNPVTGVMTKAADRLRYTNWLNIQLLRMRHHISEKTS